MKEGYRVTMDSDVENATNIFNEDGSYIKFVCVCVCVCVCVYIYDRLYCVNLDGDGEHTNYLTTVSEQKDHFF